MMQSSSLITIMLRLESIVLLALICGQLASSAIPTPKADQETTTSSSPSSEDQLNGSSTEEADPCKGHKCLASASCVVEDGKAVCKCPKFCTKIYAPVCGTDGTTYANECTMNVQNCELNKEVAVAYQGKCEKDTTVHPTVPSTTTKADHETTTSSSPSSEDRVNGSPTEGADPCKNHKCLARASCVVEDGKAVCKCPNWCSNIYVPVCGTDGTTYGSECFMNVQNCKLNKKVAVAYRGKCEKDTTVHPTVPSTTTKPCSLKPNNPEPVGQIGTNQCTAEGCGRIGFCFYIFGFPTCHCRSSCPVDGDAVCGSDGVTYKNECLLKEAACLGKRDICVAHFGGCCHSSLPVLVNPTPGPNPGNGIPRVSTPVQPTSQKPRVSSCPKRVQLGPGPVRLPPNFTYEPPTTTKKPTTLDGSSEGHDDSFELSSELVAGESLAY